MLEIIWNVTKVCPWNCKFCCVSATYTNKNNLNLIKNKLQSRKEELSYKEKLKILKDLAKNKCSVDFSGGDPLWCEEDIKLIKKATELLPKKKISISMSGGHLNNKKIGILKKVNCVELTVDGIKDDGLRPKNFNTNSIISLKKLKNEGIKTRAITVLHKNNLNINKLKQIYSLLSKLKIPEWELLRFYNVGRAIHMIDKTPSIYEYMDIIKKLKRLKGFTKIIFQHSLRTLIKPIECPAAKNSFGILPNGSVIACAWGINQLTKPLHSIFYLGKMPKEKLKDILNKEKTNIWRAGTKYCKISRFTEYKLKNIKKPEKSIIKVKQNEN